MIYKLSGRLLNYIRTLRAMTHFQPVVLSGPSGSGKSTLVKRLMAEYDCFAFSVSHTTRKPRAGEVAGKDYYYVSRDEMQQAIDDNEFIEYAEFSANMYGTSKKAVEAVIKTGKICILDIDEQGVKSVKQTDLNPRYIFVQTNTLEELEARLRGRNSETDESLQRRLTTAKSALEYSKEKGAYDHIIVNEHIDISYEKLKGILIKDIDQYTKEKHKAH